MWRSDESYSVDITQTIRILEGIPGAGDHFELKEEGRPPIHSIDEAVSYLKTVRHIPTFGYYHKYGDRHEINMALYLPTFSMPQHPLIPIIPNTVEIRIRVGKKKSTLEELKEWMFPQRDSLALKQDEI